MDKQDKSYWQQKYDSFAVQNANLSKNQIVFIGDSITDLYPLDDYYTDLTKATYNRGIAGDTTLGILQRMKVSLYDLAPSKIVLMIGINDINGGRSVEDIANSYNSILTQIKQNLPTTHVFCMSILPMSETILNYADINLDERNTKVRQVNSRIIELANAYGYSYVNLYEQVCNDSLRLKNEYTDDGIHLNANGFAVWTSVVKPYLV